MRKKLQRFVRCLGLLLTLVFVSAVLGAMLVTKAEAHASQAKQSTFESAPKVHRPQSQREERVEPKADPRITTEANFWFRLLELIKDNEGFRSRPYDDNGKRTVGFGTTLEAIGITETEFNRRHPNGINKAQADIYLRQVLEQKTMKSARRYSWFEGLSWNRKMVPLYMIFNNGATSYLGFKRHRAAMSRSDWQKAADEMVDSKWYRKDAPRAAKRMVTMMRTNLYPAKLLD